MANLYTNTLFINEKEIKNTKALSTSIVGSTSSTTYSSIRSITYSPSGLIPIEKVRVVSNRTAGTGTYSLRLYDITNAVTIAQLTGLNNTTSAIQNLTILAQPSTNCTLQLQALVSVGTTTVFVDSLNITL